MRKRRQRFDLKKRYTDDKCKNDLYLLGKHKNTMKCFTEILYTVIEWLKFRRLIISNVNVKWNWFRKPFDCFL